MKTRKPWETSSNIWTHEDVKTKFKAFVVGLKMPRPGRKPKAPHMEKVTEALWSWFSDLSKADAEEFLTLRFAEIEAFTRCEGPRAEIPAPEHEVENLTRPPTKKASGKRTGA